MTKYHPKAAPFTCAICLLTAPYQFEFAARQSIPPLCATCERVHGVGDEWMTSRDKRLIKQISALASALSVAAHCAERNLRYPHARA